MSFPKYPEYVESGVEWLGEVPKHWTCNSLKKGYVVTLGKMLQPERKANSDVLKPYIRAANIQWAGIDVSDVKEMWFSPAEIESLSLELGDLLVSEGCDVGRSALWRHDIVDCYFQNSVNRIRPFGENSTEYLYYWMSALKDKGFIDVVCNKSTIAHFTAEKVQAVPVLFPPPEEQSAIAAFLDRETAKIDALVAEQEKLIELLKEKRQAVISHAVTKGLDPNVPMKDSGVEWLGDVPEHWPVKRLKQVGRLIGGAGFPHEFQGQESEVLPFYKVGDIGRSPDGRTMKGSENTVSLETAESLRAKIIPEGSIVYAKIGAAMLLNRRRITEIQCCIDNNMTAFIPNRSLITTEWAFYWLCLLDFGELANPGAVPSFSEGDQANLIILQPPVQEQIEIAELINGTNHKMSSLICEAQNTITLLKERRSALISAAVTGKIDVRGLVDPISDNAMEKP